MLCNHCSRSASPGPGALRRHRAGNGPHRLVSPSSHPISVLLPPPLAHASSRLSTPARLLHLTSRPDPLAPR
ncbi:hypothetical protein BD310DRAFT_938838 [Dichomitus squalens]|uniref:Uncharacterized protein n=1 Tax=Dichomitus squalens TaxID=114155 RepID=A0A4Q9PEB3_9APHY|nr:hypothetical protein BD310DRAFT_938838 [Dichomitus squalens]